MRERKKERSKKKNPEKQDFLNSLPAALFGSNPFPCLSYQPQSTSSVLLLKCHCKPSVGQLNRHMRSLAKKDIPNVLCSPGTPGSHHWLPQLTCPYTARWLDRLSLCGSWEKSAGSGYMSTPLAPKSWALATWGREMAKGLLLPEKTDL